MTLRRNVTDKTHSADGSKTISQMHRDADVWRDSQPMLTRCSVHGCDWAHHGSAGEGRDAYLAHRTVEHPTANGIAAREARRNGMSDREHFQAQAAERRQQIALRALDAGQPQSEVVGREPQAGETDRSRSPGAHELEAPATPSPGPDLSLAEPGSRPRWNRDNAIAELRTVAERIGHVPRSDHIAGTGLPGKGTIHRLFGGWANYVDAAGFARPVAGRPTSEERERRTVGAGPPPRSSDVDPFEPDVSLIVAEAVELVGGAGAGLVERLIGEADRLDRRARSLRQIAQGVEAFNETQAAA